MYKLDKEDFLALAVVLLVGTVFSLVWSVGLYLVLGLSPVEVRPWSVYEFLFRYGLSGQNANVIGTSFLIAITVVAVGVGAVFFLKPKHYFGDARWANAGEIRRARLIDPGGIIIGRRGSTFMRNDEPGHVLVAAQSRSGKGVGLVIPNLLSWPGSAIVLDIKHENHDITSGFRGQHQRVIKWSPMDDDGRSHGYNPFSEIRQDIGHRVSDLQRLATILLPLSKNADPMWQNEARDLFLGIALFVMDNPQVPSTIGEVYRTLKSETDLADIAELIIKDYGDTLDPGCRMSLSNFLHKAPKERSGVKSNLTASLNLWANPVIDAATSHSSFSFAELRKRPTSVYVGVKQNQLKTLAPLIGLFFQQCVDVLGRDIPGPDEPHQVLMMIDEFASLGRMDTIETALAFLAGYNIRLVLIVQGLGQLYDLYDKGAENILQNSAIQVYFAANDETTAVYISKRLGTKTMKVHSQSDPGGFRFMTKSTSSAARSFMLPEEVRQMKDTKEIIFKSGARPILGDKIKYYRDKAFTSRLLAPTQVPQLDIRPIQPRVFQTPAAGTREPSGGAVADDGGFDFELPQKAERMDEAAEAAELLAMGQHLATLLEPENKSAADELKNALSEFESPER